jgi:hypothetical protein
MKKILLLLSAFLLMAGIGSLNAQTPSGQPADTLTATVVKLSKTVQTLDKIKFSGYIQAQYQFADTLGAKSFNGGDFTSASAQRFQVRRGYLKMAYNGKLSTYVLQVNLNERGFTLRDAYFSVKDPWLKAFSLTGGIFFRPFGYELAYSASLRESPESSRITQTLFPNERDLGASLTFQMPDKSKWHPIKIEAGLFSGNSTAAETDDKLDFIGRIGYSDSDKKKTLTWGLGASYYNGWVYQGKKEVYEMNDFEGIQAFRQRLADTVPGNYFNRRYLGFDAQLSVKTPAGTTTLRGDYMTGTQPGAEKSSISPQTSTLVDYALYLRKFSGASVYLVQALPGNIHSVVLRYDYYDPNTGVSKEDLGQKATSAKATNGSDAAFTTWGFGYLADITQNIRVTLYYDLVKNETSSSLSGYHADQKDNVFTLRVQYKF